MTKIPLGCLALSVALVLPIYGQTIPKEPPPPIPDYEYGLHVFVVMEIGRKYRHTHDNARPVSREDRQRMAALASALALCASKHSAIRKQALVIPSRKWGLAVELASVPDGGANKGQQRAIQLARERLQDSQSLFQDTIRKWRSVKNQCVRDTNEMEQLVTFAYSDYQRRYNELWAYRMKSGYSEGW